MGKLKNKLTFQNDGKDRRTASVGKHHYAISGDYYHGYEAYYATGATPPPFGPDWTKIGDGGSMGKCEPVCRRHFNSIKGPNQ